MERERRENKVVSISRQDGNQLVCGVVQSKETLEADTTFDLISVWYSSFLCFSLSCNDHHQPGQSCFLRNQGSHVLVKYCAIRI